MSFGTQSLDTTLFAEGTAERLVVLRRKKGEPAEAGPPKGHPIRE